MNQPATRIDTATLDPLETASVDELRATQVKRLKWSLKHAYDNVPFYRQSFDKAGVHPDDIQTLEDLAKLPFTTKADLRDNYPFGMLATPMSEIVRIHASSGTTGQPTVVGYTQNDIDVWSDVMARSIRAAGGSRNDKVHVAYGYGLFTGGLGAHYGAERLGCAVIPMSGGPTIWEDHFYPEIIDPVSGDALPDGEYGELVFTTLTKEGLPVIRYRTRDLTRLLPGTARPMRRIDKITGRSDDMLIIRGVNVFPTQIEEQLLKIASLSPHYEIEVSRQGNMDMVLVRVEANHHDIARDPVACEEAAKQLQHSIKTHIGISTQVEVCPVESVMRSMGKAKRVKDVR